MAEKKRKQGRALVTVIPPYGKPAPWYGYTRACKHCEAAILNSIVRTNGALAIRVRHEAGCKGVEQ